MTKWLTQLRFDPTPTLLSSGNEAIAYFTKRDLLEQMVASINQVWQLREVQRTLRNQQPDGSWKYTGKKTVCYPKHHYPLLQTWKTCRVLAEQYEFTKKHHAARKAAEFLFSCQTEQGARAFSDESLGLFALHCISLVLADLTRSSRRLKISARLRPAAKGSRSRAKNDKRLRR